MLKGITVTLYERTVIGRDEFNKTKYNEIPVEVDNVLIEPVTGDDVVSAESLYGKKAVYRLCLPKGDSHKWEDSRIIFFSKEYKSFGPVLEYIEENLPLSWNKKVMVERYGK